MADAIDPRATARRQHDTASVAKHASDSPSRTTGAELKDDGRTPAVAGVPTLQHAAHPFDGFARTEFAPLMPQDDLHPPGPAYDVAGSALASEVLSKIAASVFREATETLQRAASKRQTPRPAGARPLSVRSRGGSTG
jgi:hypothetical protein